MNNTSSLARARITPPRLRWRRPRPGVRVRGAAAGAVLHDLYHLLISEARYWLWGVHLSRLISRRRRRRLIHLHCRRARRERPTIHPISLSQHHHSTHLHSDPVEPKGFDDELTMMTGAGARAKVPSILGIVLFTCRPNSQHLPTCPRPDRFCSSDSAGNCLCLSLPTLPPSV